MPIRLVQRILGALVECRLVSETETNAAEGPGFQPAQDTATITVHAVLAALDRRGADILPVLPTASLTALSETVAHLGTAAAQAPANRLLKDI